MFLCLIHRGEYHPNVWQPGLNGNVHEKCYSWAFGLQAACNVSKSEIKDTVLFFRVFESSLARSLFIFLPYPAVCPSLTHKLCSLKFSVVSTPKNVFSVSFSVSFLHYFAVLCFNETVVIVLFSPSC